MNRFSYFKTIASVLFLITTAVTIYSDFFEVPKPSHPPFFLDEKFDASLLCINSCEKLDSLVLNKFKQTNYDTAVTVRFIDQFLRNRFYHSYSELRVPDNWIANICGKLIWADFLYPVRPCDIIKYPMAACSQQGIVFQHQLDLLKIPTSTIKFLALAKKTPGHYAVSVYYGSTWHYYDPNQEPLIIDSTMPNINMIIDKKLYEKMYIKKSNVRFQKFFRAKSYQRIKKEPFTKGNMYYFQTITGFLSNWLWLMFFTLYLVLLLKTRK